MSAISDVLTLARAGFNAQQIAVLMSNSASASAPVASAPVGQDGLVQRLDTITQLLQTSNILGAVQPQPETVEDVFASIINPKGDK